MRSLLRALILSAWAAAVVMSTLLPALQKTWQFHTATVTGGAFDVLHRATLYQLKQGFVTPASSPWTVAGSSNGVASGMDGVDRWSSATAPLPSSWIVLEQAALGTIQVCWLTQESPGNGDLYMFVSPAVGFSGGAPTVRPTAADEILVSVNVRLGFTDVSDVYVAVAAASDGTATRAWAIQSGTPITWAIFDLIHNAIAELTTPWVAYNNSRTAGAGDPGAASYNDFDTTGPLVGWQGSTQLSMFPILGNRGSASDRTGEDSGVNNAVNQLSSDYPMAAAALACTTASNRGVHGELVDLWFGSVSAQTGDTYPEAAYAGAGGLDQFAQVGDVILPWNGTVPLTGGGARARRQARVPHTQQTFTPPQEGTVPIIHTAGFGGSTGAELATVSPIYTSGDVWFVHSGTGTDAVSPAGKSREQPLATLAQAQTNAAAGDVIVILAGHSETLGTKLTLSKAGLILLGEGSGAGRPLFNRSADVNLFDVTGAGIRLENLRFNSDAASAYAADRVLISANSCIVRGCYFVCGANDSASPALAVADGVTNLRIDGATYFVASGTSRTVTGFLGLALNGTTTDLELDDVVFDGGSYGWLSNAMNARSAAGRLRALNVDLLNGADVVLASSTTGVFHVRAESGAARLVWP